MINLRFDVDKAAKDMEVLTAQLQNVKKTRKYHQLITGSLKKVEGRKPLFQLEGDYSYFTVIDPEKAAKKKVRTNPYKESLISAIGVIIEELNSQSSGKDKWTISKDGRNTEISIVAHRSEQEVSGVTAFGTGKTLNSQLSQALYNELKGYPDIEILEATSNKIMISTDKNPMSVKFTNKR